MDGPETPLTGLAAELWRQAEAESAPLGLVLAEIDRFAEYGNFHGPAAADACWQAVLCCVREQLRGSSDWIAPLGHGSAAVLLPGTGAAACGEVGERLRSGVAALALPHLGTVPVRLVSLSVGAASLVPGPEGTVAALFAAGERALQAARHDGGDTVRIGLEPTGCESWSSAKRL